MRRKKAILAVAIIVFYCLLLVLLVAAESTYTAALGEETISTFPKAVWYSLTTLTTVGYGDFYPHTLLGRIIGSVFLILSVGSLVFLIGALLSWIKDHFLPKMKLLLSMDKDWYVFSELNPDSAALAKNLSRETKKSLIIFTGKQIPGMDKPVTNGICVSFPIEEIVRLKKRKGNVTVFLVGENEYENFCQASSLDHVSVYCMTEYEPDRISDQVRYFHPCQCCARLYWRRFPVINEDESIAIIGGGKYAAAILEQALIQNVFSPKQHVTYLVYGDPADFSVNHPQLSYAFSIGKIVPDRDSVLFLPGEWVNDANRWKNADRLIICFDSEEKNLKEVHRITRYFPVSGKVYARLSNALESVITFGGADEIFTPELVLHTDLDKAAIELNEIYRRNTGGNSPSWNELSDFLRRSNLASADHLEVKIRLLLGNSDPEKQANRRYERAYQQYLLRKDKEAEVFREIEHNRWMRFLVVNNWQYAPVRDNPRRMHPLLLPYDKLSPQEHAKDDFAWELLQTLSESEL